MIICCKCGISILPRPMNMCDDCLSTEIDITSRLKTNLAVEHCRQCDRYLTPPKTWETCSWQSKEMLMLLLKQNKPLQSFTLIDCDFVYTEEHSKQIEIKVTLAKDNLQKTINIKYRIKNHQCPDCQKVEAKMYWSSLVQVRQRAVHKKTLLHLEQLILQAKKFNDTSNIKERKDGIDFYYTNKTPALRMVDYIQTTLMSRVKISERLLTEDKKSNTAKYKFSYSVELAPICRDDIILVSDRICNKYGINKLNIVLKVNSSIKLIDPRTMKITKIDSRNYWGYQEEFRILMTSKWLKKFEITELELTDNTVGKYRQADVFVTRDHYDNYHCKTHLGNLLRVGGSVLGYDFAHSSLCEHVENDFKVFLVKKQKVKNRKRKVKKVVDSDCVGIPLFEEKCYTENEVMTRDLKNLEI